MLYFKGLITFFNKFLFYEICVRNYETKTNSTVLLNQHQVSAWWLKNYIPTFITASPKESFRQQFTKRKLID